MSEYRAPIPDEILKRRFQQFCLAWGVDPDQLGLDEYIAMIAMYYKDIELQLKGPGQVVEIPSDVARAVRR